jgi:hypothetical protein
MLFSYGYGQWQNQQWHQNAPLSRPVSKALRMHRSNTDGIPQCGMSRATLETTGCRHWATTCSVLPQWPPEQQANKQQSTNTPKKVAMLMAVAVRRYNTACIAWWRRSKALLEATRHCHRASIMSDNMNWTQLCWFFSMFSSSNRRKRSWVDAKTPIFNQGMTYQTKEKGLTKVTLWFIGGV